MILKMMLLLERDKRWNI